MLTITTHLWSRDHTGTWKKRPPNLLSTSSLPAKSLYLVVHCRSSSHGSLFPVTFPDLSSITLRDGALHDLESRHEEESEYGADHEMVPASFLTDKLKPSVLHYRSCTRHSEFSDTSLCLADPICRFDLKRNTETTEATTRTRIANSAVETNRTTRRNEVNDPPHPLTRFTTTHNLRVTAAEYFVICTFYRIIHVLHDIICTYY
jgi:hypothetical protein